MISINSDIKQDIKVNQNAKASVSNSVQDKLDKRKKIFKFIKLVQPSFSVKKCDNLTNSIMKYAEKYNLDPLIICTTAYIESEFKSTSKPCIGIMQVLRSTYYSQFKKTGYNPYNSDHNIAIGTLELKSHLDKYVKRGEMPDRTSYSRMWGRYNGAGKNSYYVRKALLVWKRLEKLNIEQIEILLKKSPLWK